MKWNIFERINSNAPLWFYIGGPVQEPITIENKPPIILSLMSKSTLLSDEYFCTKYN